MERRSMTPVSEEREGRAVDVECIAFAAQIMCEFFSFHSGSREQKQRFPLVFGIKIEGESME